MIDIHTHILPGVDDGAQTLQEAVRMIRQAAESGTREIILTPHCAPAYDFFNYNDDRLEERFERLCYMVHEEKIPVILHPGMEVLYEGREQLIAHMDDYASLCGGVFFLMEYYFDVHPLDFLEGICTLKECGYIPVIAHPERYRCMKTDWKLAQEGRRLGARFQVNKGSLYGVHGEAARSCAYYLLDQDIVDFIASDAHDRMYRGSRLGKVYRHIQEEYGEERARRLFVDNPMEVVRQG